MEFQSVIKVKYEDKLRRFNICHQNGLPDLDMEKLMAKVISLFNFTTDANVTLTYIDEDDDAITLVDDADLIEALKQNLNPLRINVHANIEKSGKISGNSSGSSASLGSTPVEHLLPGLNTGLTEALKLVPEPLHESLANFCLELASKAASSSPVIAEVVQTFLSEVGLNAVSKLRPNADSTRQNGDNQNPSFPSSATDMGVSKDARSVPPPELLPDTKNLVSNSKNIEVSRGVGTSFGPFSATVDLNLPPKSAPAVEISKAAPTASDVIADENEKSMNESKSKVSGKPADFIGRSDGYRRSRYPKSNNDSLCPFSGLPFLNQINQSTTHPASHPYIHPFRRGHKLGDNIPVFHKGICCDGCGVIPIAGPRYKSKVKADYDLCSVCFARMGNDADYFRMEQPAFYGHPSPSKMLLPSFHPPVPHHSRARMKPLFHSKLDSRFVLDVNVMDGTLMAPSTQFTKIWRMCNSGTAVWPPGTQLVWIGGDKLCDTVSVKMFEIPPFGVPMEAELDIAVDFKAPELPGRYISYWKMSLPSGQQFGERIWVLIEVDPSLKETSCESLRGLNLNLPPESCGPESSDFIDAEGRRLIEVSPPGFWNSSNHTESAEQAVGKETPVGNDIPATDPPMISSSVSYPVVDFAEVPPAATSHEPSSSVIYPVVDFANVSPVATSFEPSLVRNALESCDKIGSNEDVDQIMPKELKEMGTKQVDLNKEISRMSEFILEQSADDLSGVAEWDPILEELEEMGFRDAENNRKLLKKNNGSILRAVMELVAGEKNSAKEKTQ